MHFFPSQSEQLFFLLLFGLFCETFTFPFLQEIGTESQQQQQQPAAAAAVFVAQNVATPKEKQPPSLQQQQQKGIPVSGIGIEKGESQSAAQIAERPSEPESAEEVVESELSAVINRINTVDSFHEQLELEKETDGGGKDQHGNGKNKPPAEQMGETAHGHFEPAVVIIAETTTSPQMPELTTAELMPMKEEANGPKQEEKVPTQKEEDHLMEEKMGPPTTSAPNEYIAVELMQKENSKKEEEEKEKEHLDKEKEKPLPQKSEAMASLAIENATNSHLTLEYSEAEGRGDSKKIDVAEGEMEAADGNAENGTAKINDRQSEQPKDVGMPKEEEEKKKFFPDAPVPVPDDGTTTIDGPSIQGHPPAPPAAAGQYLVESSRVGPTEMAMNGKKGNDEEDEDEEEDAEGNEENGEGLSLWDKIVLGLRCARQDCRDTLIDGDEEAQQRPIKGWKITRRARRSTAPGDHNQINKIECPCTYILHN